MNSTRRSSSSTSPAMNIAPPSRAARAIRATAAAAATLALARRAPVTRVAGRALANGPGLTRGSGYDAVLRWQQPNAEPDLAGFVVVMRSTIAPDWEREFWAGNVHEFTLKDTPI